MTGYKCVPVVCKTANYVIFQGVRPDNAMESEHVGCVSLQKLTKIMFPKTFI